ncbi:D-alanine--poly(phosphoribitol) ligase subunit DltA [Oenococcus sp. UCMA 17063]|nr:D-alanine--poly(phosphoribitol) ligase subunit DltA [Oenococcus sp. UCMA 17063]
MIRDILSKIDENAINDPKSIVYDNLGKQNNYADLKEYSDSLAAYIDRLGIADGASIMIFGGQEFEMIASFLAAAKSGHPYIPVDINSSDERINSIIEIADPALVIAINKLPIEISNRSVVEADQLQTIFSANLNYQIEHAVSGEKTFYIIFTSGTTGEPKGVQISSDNLLSFVNWIVGEQFNLPDHPVMLSQPPFSFDLSVMDWVPTLVLGGRLQAVPREIADDFKGLFQTLPKYNPQVFVSTPSFVDLCLIDPDFNEEKLSNVCYFLFCGEELTKKTALKLIDRFPKAKIFNTYGPTEATVAVSQVEITKKIIEESDRLPIGYPKADTHIAIFDNQQQSLLEKQTGEIVIYGPSVSKGYLNNPKKTQGAFFTYKGQQAYRTGDLGRFDDKGLLHYGGRKDFQIKLHGYRIELEEVSHGLMKSRFIKQAVAVPRYDDDHKVSQLLAWVVPRENDFTKKIDLTKALKEDLKEIMMPYMIPSRFVYKESLPISANGKIDIKKAIAEVNNG